MKPETVIAVARRLAFVRETDGQNRGLWVGMLQRFCGGQDADPWCADYASFVLDVAYAGKSPLMRTGSTKQLLNDARMKGLVVDAPVLGGLFFYVYETSREPHHVGIVSDLGPPIVGIAGNTSFDGASSEGTGVFEHAISIAHAVFVRLP